MKVEFSEYIGGAVYLHAPHHEAGRLTVRCPGVSAPPNGAITLGIERERCHVFTMGGQRLS
jgi:hypothetical protein